MEIRQEHIELIIRYFSGESTSEELVMISRLLQSDEYFQQEFNDQKEIWGNVELTSIQNNININDEWNKLKKSIHKEETTVIPINKIYSKNKFSFALKIAAVFILVAVSAFVVYNLTLNNEPKQIQFASQNTVIEKTLPDGTVVSMNAHSNIGYPEQFAANNRAIKLHGHAFFNVTPDKTKPFIIDAENIYVEVLGTSFSVNTNANGKSEVIVTTGKVAVYKKMNPSEKVLLAPGEKATFSNNQEPIIKSANSDENCNSWKTHRMVFTDEYIENIVNQLNAVYNSKIAIGNKNIATCKVTVTFDNQSLDAVLKVLQATIDIQVSQTGENIVINGNGCK